MMAESDALQSIERGVTRYWLRVVITIAAALLTVMALIFSLLPYAVEQGGVIWLKQHGSQRCTD